MASKPVLQRFFSSIVLPHSKQKKSTFSKLQVDEDSYLVVYTPSHFSDEKCLHFAVGTRAGYIGMIGSKKKVKEIKERLLQKEVSQQQLDMVHAPIGIDIGAETPEEIAISILAQIVSVKRTRGAGK